MIKLYEGKCFERNDKTSQQIDKASLIPYMPTVEWLSNGDPDEIRAKEKNRKVYSCFLK